MFPTQYHLPWQVVMDMLPFSRFQLPGHMSPKCIWWNVHVTWDATSLRIKACLLWQGFTFPLPPPPPPPNFRIRVKTVCIAWTVRSGNWTFYLLNARSLQCAIGVFSSHWPTPMSCDRNISPEIVKCEPYRHHHLNLKSLCRFHSVWIYAN